MRMNRLGAADRQRRGERMDRRRWLPPPDLLVSGLAAGALIMVFGGSAHAAVPVPAATPRAIAYQQGKDFFFLFDFAFGLAVAAVFFAAGWSGRLRDLAGRIGHGRWFWTVSVTVIAYTTLIGLITVPVDWCEDFVLPHRYGISTETASHWLANEATGLAVNAVLVLAVAWVPYLLLRRRPRDWWLWATGAMLPLVLVFVAIGPVFISPLFNHFAPLADKHLETVLRAEAARVGLGDAPILVMDQSSESKAPGAYVTGLWGTRRIVLYDTLVKSFDEKQIQFVLGHEMKHYLLDDVWKLVGLGALILLAGFFTVDRLGRFVVRHWGKRVGVADLADPASIPVLIGAFSVAVFVLTPVLNLASQSIEHEADRFGLELTQNNAVAASAFVKLQQDALGVPDPSLIARIWRTNHPTLRDRIDFANTYHPWADGQALVYGAYMKP
jgi:Zn-dependent protease with chaperone function